MPELAEAPEAGGFIRDWWEALTRPELAEPFVAARGRARLLVLWIAAMYGVYGLTMGCYRGAFPAAVSALKLPFLYLLTLGICFPALYALNCLAGPRLHAASCARALLLATSVNAVALVSYAPFSLFFAVTSGDDGYAFVVLSQTIAFGVAGVLSVFSNMWILRAAAEKKGLSLRPAFFIGWLALYGFVGVQMSWVLRPWFGTRNIPYTPLRPLSGSFLEAIIGVVKSVF